MEGRIDGYGVPMPSCCWVAGGRYGRANGVGLHATIDACSAELTRIEVTRDGCRSPTRHVGRVLAYGVAYHEGRRLTCWLAGRLLDHVAPAATLLLACGCRGELDEDGYDADGVPAYRIARRRQGCQHARLISTRA